MLYIVCAVASGRTSVSDGYTNMTNSVITGLMYIGTDIIAHRMCSDSYHVHVHVHVVGKHKELLSTLPEQVTNQCLNCNWSPANFLF